MDCTAALYSFFVSELVCWQALLPQSLVACAWWGHFGRDQVKNRWPSCMEIRSAVSTPPLAIITWPKGIENAMFYLNIGFKAKRYIINKFRLTISRIQAYQTRMLA